MREQYYGDEPSQKRWIIPIVSLIVVLVIAGTYFWLTMGKSDLVYPVPPKADFEVIYYTPSPQPATPTASPSATPTTSKKKAASTATPKPTAKTTSAPAASGSTTKATSTPTGKMTPSPTEKSTPTITPKPTT